MVNTSEQFGEVVEKYQRDIINFHYRFVRNRFEAEDLAQETFIKAYKKIHTLQDAAKIKSWLLSIARNVMVDSFRRNKEKSVALDQNILEFYANSETVDHRTEVLNDETSRELQTCISKLEEQDQKIVRLLYYEGFSYKEIAQLLGMNQNTLKSRLHRARASLVEIIQSNGLVTEI